MLFKVNSTLIDPASAADDKLSRSKSYSCLPPASTSNSITSSASTANLRPCSGAAKRFHSSQLGRPPGSTTNQKPTTAQIKPKPPTHMASPKIAPLKEVEKLIADLKKENFDLKLRLFHFEDMISKDSNLKQLNEENYQLRIENKRLEALLLKETKSIGTQTTQTFESSPEAFNLLPAPKRGESWQKIVANEDHLGSVVHALQQIQIGNDHQPRRPCI